MQQAWEMAPVFRKYCCRQWTYNTIMFRKKLVPAFTPADNKTAYLLCI